MLSRLNIQISGVLIFVALICNVENSRNFYLGRYSNAHCERGRIQCQTGCISVGYICDGGRDCEDMSDEIGCTNRVRVLWDIMAEGVRDSVLSSLLWLQQQRRPFIGWGNATNNVVVALSLSNSSSFNVIGDTNEASIRDLQFNLLRRIQRNNNDPISMNEMARYIHALLAACLNPRNFFTANLVKRIETELDSSSSVDPFLVLALCNANGQVPQSNIAELIHELQQPFISDPIERQAYALMALNCIRDKSKDVLERNFFMVQDVRNSVLGRLINSQTDGNYGDVYRTAIVLQALLSSEEAYLPLEPILNSFNYILSENLNELPDVIEGAYLLLPLFSGKTLLDLGRVDCSLSPFKDHDCYEEEEPCADDEKCIPSEWLCHQDCSGFSDERRCRTFIRHKIEAISHVPTARQNALSWLLSQRRTNWGWEEDTNRAIVSLYLADTERFVSGDRNNLMVKQLQIQLSKLLLRNETNSVDVQLALYVHALLATCVNPRSFQGYNLVELLKQKIDKSAPFNPFLVLALCNANEKISPEHIAKLTEVMKQPNTPETTDSLAYAAMALFCIKRRIRETANTVISNSENDMLGMDPLPARALRKVLTSHASEIFLANVASFLKGLQQQNGSFGSVYTTALALQALVTSESLDDDWNLEGGIRYLLSQQERDGSFGSILSTYLVIPLLHARTLFDLGISNCPTQYRNLTVREEFDSVISSKQRVQYSMWLGLNKDVSFSISLIVPVNKTFYDVMRLAAEVDPRYRFQYFSYPWGKYIYSMFGVVNDPEARRYWQLYQVEDENATFIDKAPEEIIPGDNEWYAYWYRIKNDN